MKNSQVFNNFPYNWWLLLLFYFIADLLICLIYKSNFVLVHAIEQALYRELGSICDFEAPKDRAEHSVGEWEGCSWGKC